jgi:hypothetical protein
MVVERRLHRKRRTRRRSEATVHKSPDKIRNETASMAFVLLTFSNEDKTNDRVLPISVGM